MRTWFAGPTLTPAEAADLSAARETALQQIIQGVLVVALLAVITNAVSALPYGDWGTILYAVLFVVLVGLWAARRLPFRVRGGVFLVMLYAVALVSLASLGLDGAGRVYLIGFTVITTALYGYRPGLAAGLLSLLTWFAVGALFSLGRLTPTSPDNQALIINWVVAGLSTLLVMVALMIPQRQFLETRRLAATAAQENAELAAAQARLAAQAAELEKVSQQAEAARAEQAAQSAALQRRATLLGLNAEVARAAAAVRDPAELLQSSVNLISERFDFYHAGLFLLDDAREWAVLRAANSAGGQRMLARGHRLRVGQQGIVGFVASSGQARVALDVGADAVHFANPDLPATRSEMAVPLRVRETIIGVLDVQSVQANAFSHEDTDVLQSLADQIALAIENARLFQEAQQRLAELQAMQREARGAGWLSGPEQASAFRYDGLEVSSLAEPPEGDPTLARDRLAIPLQFGDQALGRLELRRADEAFTSDDLELTTAIADRMALALESAQLFQQTRSRAQQLAALSEVTIELTGPQLNAQQALEQICRGALRVFEIDGAGVWLPVGTDEVELAVSLNAGQLSQAGRRVKVGEGLAGAVFATRQALRLDDYPHWPGAAEWPEAPFQSVLAVPMLWQGQALGVLMLTHAQPDRKFTADEERIAQLYASQGASTLDNARLFAETQQRLTELGAINNISQALATQLALEPLLKLVGDQVFSIFGVRNGFVALYDSQTRMMEFPYFLEAGQVQTVLPRPLGQGLTSVVINTRRPLLINHNADQRTAELGAYQQGAPARSWLGVPIPSGDNVIGVLSVQDTEREGLFGEADIRLLSTIAANAGVAIRNARLFQETELRAEQLATINEISRDLAAQLDVQSLSERLVDRLRTAFNTENAYLAVYDQASNLLRIPVMLDGGERKIIEPFPLGEGLTSVVIQTRQPLLIVQDAEQRVAELGAKTTGQPARSFLAVPVLAGEDVLGVLSVQDLQRENAFDEADMRLLSTIAANVGVALQNARLFQETQRRAEQLATAAEVSRTAISVLNPDELVTQSVELIRDRFAHSAGVSYAALFLIDETGRWATLRHATGEAGRALLERGHKLEVGGASMVGWATANRRARIALDVGAEPVRFANPLLPDTRSEIALPLVVGDSVLGALDVQSTVSGAFAEADVAVLQTMADQIAIAIRNAQLLTATQQAQRFLDSVIENLPVTLFVKNAADLRYVRWNRAGEELLGYNRDERVGKSDFDLYSAESAEVLAKDDRQVLQGAGLVDIPEEPVVTRGRGTRVLHTRKIPILDESGQPQFLLGISEDITERKAAEQAVRAAEERYRSLVEQLPAVIYANEVPAGETASRTTYISPQVQPLLGYTPDEWLADANLWVKLLHPDDRDAVLREVNRQNSTGSPLDLEYRSLTRDGRIVWFRNQSQATFDPSSGVLTARGILFDITARKQAEAALQAAQQTAQRRAQLLAAAADIARAMTASLDRDELVRTAVNLIRERFGFYHASIFTMEGGMAVLRESTGEAGRLLKARHHQLAVGSRSLVGRATSTRQPVVVQDVIDDPTHLKNPLLPDTRAEAVIPLLSGEAVVGALDVQSTLPQAFGTEDVAILVTIADQLAVALQNAQLFDQTARQARRESLVVDITGKIRAAGSMDDMLRTAVSELRAALGARQAAVRLRLPASNLETPGAPIAGRGATADAGAAGEAPAAKATDRVAPSNGRAPAAGNGNGATREPGSGNGNGNGSHGPNGSGSGGALGAGG
jgi:PAS domain S-box-containing protein